MLVTRMPFTDEPAANAIRGRSAAVAYLLDALYGLVLMVLSPWLVFRAVTTGRYREGMRQKLLGLNQAFISSDRLRVWFHGVSVGEIHLLSTIVKQFRDRHPDCQCIISTTTQTGITEAAKRFADLPIFYWPFDFSWAVNSTLRAVQPKLIVLAESELWPNFLRAASKYKFPVMVINGRMSPRSARRYRKLAWLARPFLFSQIAKFAMQTESYAQSLRDLGLPADRIAVTGSAKYDGVLGDRHNPHTRKLAELLGITDTDRVWVAGSTHDPEEEIVLDIFRRLKQNCADLRLVLAPRNADRFEEVARLIERHGLSFVRKSKLTQTITDHPSVILIDTIGDLNAAWGLADVGFTGGSLDGKRGGQSMIEPAGLGIPVVFGPHVWNFRDAALRLTEVGGAIRVNTPAELEQELLRLLKDRALREQMGTAARKMVITQQGATRRTLDVIDDVLGVGGKSRISTM